MSSTSRFHIRLAEPTDVESIKFIADSHTNELGFVLRPALIEGIRRKSVLVARTADTDTIVAFVHFHHRLDFQTKIYQICVMPAYRNQGIAAGLIDALKSCAIKAGQATIALHCPEDLAANLFYKALGFSNEGVVAGRKRRLVTWWFPLRLGAARVPEGDNADGS